MKNYRKIWLFAALIIALVFLIRLPSGSAFAQNVKAKNTTKVKKDKLPGRLGLGFGPFYNHYILSKAIKR